MNTLFDIIGLLQAIPAAFWGVVVGSFFSIAGIAATNLASDRRLLVQFEHEREQKTRDREMTLRKEIYLAAAEAIAAGMNSIGRFANFDLPNDQITSAYGEKVPSIARVHVIARTDTLKALVAFTGQLEAAFLTLFAKRHELLKEKNTIALLENQIAEFGKERDRILEMIKQQNIEGIVNERRWQVLQDSFDFEQKRVYDGLARQAELVGMLHPKHLEFVRECVGYTANLSKALVPVLSAVRAELEQPLDELAYRQVMETGLANQQEAIAAYIQRFMPTAAQPVNPPALRDEAAQRR